MKITTLKPPGNQNRGAKTRINYSPLHVRISRHMSHRITSPSFGISNRPVKSRKKTQDVIVNVLAYTKTFRNIGLLDFSQERILDLIPTQKKVPFLSVHRFLHPRHTVNISSLMTSDFQSRGFVHDTTVHRFEMYQARETIRKKNKSPCRKSSPMSVFGLREGQRNSIRRHAYFNILRHKPDEKMKSSHPSANMSESAVSYSQFLYFKSTHRSTLKAQQHPDTSNLHRNTSEGSANSCNRDIPRVQALSESCNYDNFMTCCKGPRSSELNLCITDHSDHNHYCKMEEKSFPRRHHKADSVWLGQLHSTNVVITALLLCLIQLSCAAILGPPWPEPVFLPRLLNVTARHGGRALLPCAVHYLGTRQVTWRRLGSHHFLSVGDLSWVKDPNLKMQFRELTPEVSEWNLVIRNVTPADQGTYECKISDKNELYRHVHLRVVGPPLVKKAQRPPVAISGKNYVETGHPIRLFCNVTGPEGLPLKIDWFKDGDSLQYPSPRNAIITNYNLVETNVLVSELFIDRSIASDSGIYICRSTMGIKSKTVTVLFADTSNVKRADSSNVKRAGEIKVESSSHSHGGLRFLQLLIWISITSFIHRLVLR